MNDPNFRTQTYQYHKATYGQNFTYDDFISNFTATNFNAESWVNLIAAAGAQYMVPVTSMLLSHTTKIKSANTI
jgi:alpha-L-fucosidase